MGGACSGTFITEQPGQSKEMVAGEVSAEEIDAVYKDGVLRLTVPKSEISNSKDIEGKH
jgi:HSP20 family molecular chaperone IbpA